MEDDPSPDGPASPQRSPRQKSFSSVFRKNPRMENTGPLQKDQQQQALVEAALAKSRASGKSPSEGKAADPVLRRSLKDKVKDALSPRGSSAKGAPATAPAPAAAAPAAGTTPAVPPKPSAAPPLPKKVRDASPQDFIFCVECGARNKRHRTQCVSCGTELEVPEALQAVAAPAPPAAPAPAVAECCVVSGAGLASGPQSADGTARFQVRLMDAHGQPTMSSAQRVHVEIEGPAGEVVPDVVQREGLVEVTYERREPGEYSINITLGDTPVADAPYELSVGVVVSPQLSTAGGIALEDGVFARTPAIFVVDARDLHGNLCTAGGCEVSVKVDAASSLVASPKSPRIAAADGKPADEPTVRDLGDGSYEVRLEYAGPGLHRVEVLLNGESIEGSPFEVRVDKAPSAGSKWQAKFEDEAAARRRQREEERIAEIETAKRNYLEHAAEAKAAAALKEARQLEEEERQRQIAEHMERMRTEEGDEVRAAVLDKVKAQASTDIYEPVAEDAGSPRGAGKKWAAQFTEEDRARREQRERERLAEIEAAKLNYLESANTAVAHALTKEERQLAEQKRLADIDAHQRTLRMQNNLGGLAAIHGDDVPSDPSSPSDDDDAPSSELTSEEDDTPARPVAVGKRGGRQSPPTPSSGSSSQSQDDEAALDLPPPSSTSPRNVGSGASSPRDVGSGAASPKSPRANAGSSRTKRGEVPDTDGVQIALADFRKGSAHFAHRGDVDVAQLEAYLSDTDFVALFGMSKAKFYQLPSWRRLQIKKEKNVM